MIKFTFLASCVIFLSQTVSSQPLALGQWKAELPYRNAYGVAASDNKIYCATELAAFTIDKNDYSLERMSKVTGLSDIGTSLIGFDKGHNLAIICYTNSNIDILKDGEVINISDIERKNIVGDKSINGLYFYGDYAYLSCGFGIVVLDLVKFEIKDTYYIGLNGTSLQINDVASDGTYLYAATITGIQRGALNDPNLVDFTKWYSFLPTDGIHGGNYSDVVAFNGKIYASKADTIFQLTDDAWSPWLIRSGYNVKKMEGGETKLVISQIAPGKTGVMTVSTTGQLDSLFSGQPYQAIEDNGSLWIADAYNGLRHVGPGVDETFIPNGPWTNRVFDLAVNSNSHSVYVAPGGYNGSFGFVYNRDGFFTRIDDTWSNHDIYNTPELIDTFDIVCATVDPVTNLAYYGSMWNGVIEYDDKLGITNQYNDENSSLSGTNGDIQRVKAADIAFDRYHNMWVSNIGALVPICVRKDDGTWLDFQPPFSIDQQWVTQIAFDDYNQVWFILPRQGIMVFNYGADLESKSDDQFKKLVNSPGQGNLPSLNVNCMATDKDGNIWVGTDQGVTIFYCPGDEFTDFGCDAQQIVITAADGYNGYLLGTENVKRISIDGANRKWFATDNGVWLFSEDGTEQILNFTTENSPLFSNYINALDIDNSTGEVYIGTEKGILIYRGDATTGSTKSCGPLVYPNPVREDYQGPIAISGVVNDAEVKITDAEGNLIYKTKALGGQVIWNGNDYNGERASTGIYLVIASNEDGSVTCITKLLVVN